MSLEQLSSIYFPSECDIDQELFYPVACSSKSMDCMVGYFTSGSLKELARSISAYLSIDQSTKMRLIVSPTFSDADMQAIRDGLETDENIVPLLFPDFRLEEETLRSKSVTALFYLIAKKKIELKIALKSSGILHTKCWLFNTDHGEVAIHGSGNATQGGLSTNFEQLILSRNWLDRSSEEIVKGLRDRFDRLWRNDYPGVYTAGLNVRTIDFINRIQLESKEVSKLKIELEQLLALDSSEVQLQKATLKIPDWLRYSEGKFSHQGKAINAWKENNYAGILSIATGGGKTLTSLVGATLLNQINDKLFLVIAVPTKPLLDQWAEEVEQFGIKPIICNDIPQIKIKNYIKNCFKNLRLGVSNSECIIITHEGLKSSAIEEISVSKRKIKTLLIADEVHNLGSLGFREVAPKFFDYKLGLSATHERQYDEDGSNFLLEYFGGVVFEYGLDEAIGNCLVTYKYFPKTVYLTPEEQDDFADLTFEIKKLSFAFNSPSDSKEAERLKILCMKRRKIIETASNKVEAFKSLVNEKPGSLVRALVFCSDKKPEQLQYINEILTSKKQKFHQVTQAETSNKKLLKSIVSDFNDGNLNVLTSMRVLDEGFNVPQTENAFLLANNTVRRQWIQRLGRVLRLSPATGKREAIIYDFVALPFLQDDVLDRDLESLIKGEYIRVKFFTELASNSASSDGGLLLVSNLLELMKQK
ncbi:DEAD/DEAH box helicase family protein [Alteromonas australica]|jgi:superfamily II DNA or RNA helicase|uniref:DEAD/DEAH box helicase family protein n=3 Tax=Alteromonadales TaxID=135622 RepID=UPI0023549B9C|nr:DEAD/DEAH box helicase family protein [Alteromonas australica]|tara:strand:+ start:5409 stop:7511 length:2103 start_codon:yes stop_codon:yes gene_type:complete